jgi:hypothetical protein
MTRAEYNSLVATQGAAYADMVAASDGIDNDADPIQNVASQNSILNSITGTLGKAADTFLDALALGAANKVVGTIYPTGQQDPAAVAARLQAEQLANQNRTNWMPWVIGGSIAFVGILTLAVVLPRSSK